MRVEPIQPYLSYPWILKIHYAKRIPSISHAFGLFLDGVMIGVVTYGVPASPFLCRGICGDENKDIVLELNRLVLRANDSNLASMLIGRSLRQLPKPRIIVSYADTKYNHIGYVYQATNFIYTGMTKERTDMFSVSGHSRHNGGDPSIRQDRSSKHRYIFFVANKTDRKKLLKSLRYEILPYPKGDTINYEHSDIEGSQILMF